MKAHEFCYWLQGFFELTEDAKQFDNAGNAIEKKGLSAEQTEKVKQHLAMVFIHDIDPKYPAKEQSALNTAHAGHSPNQIFKPQSQVNHGGAPQCSHDVKFRC